MRDIVLDCHGELITLMLEEKLSNKDVAAALGVSHAHRQARRAAGMLIDASAAAVF
jgi:hypothetical protein